VHANNDSDLRSCITPRTLSWLNDRTSSSVSERRVYDNAISASLKGQQHTKYNVVLISEHWAGDTAVDTVTTPGQYKTWPAPLSAAAFQRMSMSRDRWQRTVDSMPRLRPFIASIATRTKPHTPCPDKKWTHRTSVIASRNVSQFNWKA